MFKVNNKDTVGVFIVNFEHISHLFLLSLLNLYKNIVWGAITYWHINFRQMENGKMMQEELRRCSGFFINFKQYLLADNWYLICARHL